MDSLCCKTVADLKKFDANEFVDAASLVIQMRMFPERDGKLLPLNPSEAIANGAVKDI